MNRKRFLATSAAGLVTAGFSGCSVITGPDDSFRIPKKSLPVGEVGTDYLGTIEVKGGEEPYRWSQTGGNWPPGLNLNEGTGAITGVPSSRGEWTFKIRVTDQRGKLDERLFTLFVAQPSRVFGLYDNFDGEGGWQDREGSNLAVEGQLSPALWGFSNGLYTVVRWDGSDGVDRGRVLRMERPDDEAILVLNNPEAVLFQDCGVFSGDFMIPPDVPAGGCIVGLRYHTSVPDRGISHWECSLCLLKNGDEAFVSRRVIRYGTGGNSSGGKGWPVYEVGTWQNLGLGFEVAPTSQLAIQFYIDGELMETFPLGLEDSSALLDSSAARVGPIRSLRLGQDLAGIAPEPNQIGYVDNVRADYLDQDLPPS